MRGGFASAARIALGSVRLANGTAALLAPDAAAKRLGVEPLANPAAVYVVRMFGIRTVLLGYELFTHDRAARARALRLAPVIHATDAAAAILAGASGRLPRRAAAVATAISTVNTVLALTATRAARGRTR